MKNDSKKIYNNPTYQKSRVSKSKRFNSTNARYKNVINKMERDDMNTKQLRKFSQGIIIS